MDLAKGEAMTLVPLAAFWLVGLMLGDWLQPPWPMPALLSGLLLLLLVLWPRLFATPRRAVPPAGEPAGRCRAALPSRLLALTLVAALGALRWSLAQPTFGPGDAVAYADRRVELRGTVVGEGEAQPHGLVFILATEALRLEGSDWLPVQGLVQVQGDRFLQVAYGDRLQMGGTLVRPRSSPQSLYAEGLARQGIYVRLTKVGQVERLPEKGGFLPAQALSALRAWARARLESLLPEPQASLLVGILLGSRASIPADIQEAFSRSGTTHILAISGWNINIVGAFLAAAGRSLPRRFSWLLVLLGIVLYTLFVGASAAVLRAALMGLLYVVARQVGRPGHGPTALLAAAWAMTLWSPGLLWDIGFQLSFGATLGMLLFVPVWTEYLRRWPRFLGESLAATLSSQLLTWPLLALYFRQFSLVVPLANLLACPALPPLMLLGTLTLLLGTIPLLGPLCAGLAWLVATYMLTIVRWTGSLPWAVLELPPLGWGFLVAYYGAIGWWYRSYRSSVVSSQGSGVG